VVLCKRIREPDERKNSPPKRAAEISSMEARYEKKEDLAQYSPLNPRI